MLEFSLKLIIGLFGAALVAGGCFCGAVGAAIAAMFVITFEQVKETFLCTETR